jgi:regulatory helix-turn-helix LysR family protein
VTIAAVADALQFTPSAGSQQLAVLEREAGVRLLERAALADAPTAATRDHCPYGGPGSTSSPNTHPTAAGSSSPASAG